MERKKRFEWVSKGKSGKKVVGIGGSPPPPFLPRVGGSPESEGDFRGAKFKAAPREMRSTIARGVLFPWKMRQEIAETKLASVSYANRRKRFGIKRRTRTRRVR